MSFKVYDSVSDTITIDLELKKYISRSYDGSGNNLNHPEWGSNDISLLRKSFSSYADGISTLATRGTNNPNPRTISNLICKSDGQTPNTLGLSNMIWIWGQFIDHELDLTETTSSEPEPITTPSTPEEEYPNRTILFNRSHSVFNSSPREQPNMISSFIDGVNTYGFKTERAKLLRKMDGTGKLKTSTVENGEIFPPLNVTGATNSAPAGSTASDFFLSGDIRANENVFLLGMHTLFVREHNRLCDQLATTYPNQDELIYQHARKLVTGFMQHITYNEFLPAILGPLYTNNTPTYDNTVNPGIKTEFSTVGFRFGHTMIPSNLLVSTDTTQPLRDLFFNVTYPKTNGIDTLLYSATQQVMEQIDGKIVDELRNFLFGPPTSTNMLDLATLNIQRGRDHGIPGYNDVREAYGLPRLSNFTDITTNTTVSNNLSTLYNSVDDIDPWIGAIVEDHISGSAVGPLIFAILHDQFESIKVGDRFWFENDESLSAADIVYIKNTKLSDIINRNCNVTVKSDVFHV